MLPRHADRRPGRTCRKDQCSTQHETKTDQRLMAEVLVDILPAADLVLQNIVSMFMYRRGSNRPSLSLARCSRASSSSTRNLEVPLFRFLESWESRAVEGRCFSFHTEESTLSSSCRVALPICAMLTAEQYDTLNLSNMSQQAWN